MKVCGTCYYNALYDDGSLEYCCGNEESDMYGLPTCYDDTCEEWEEEE